LKVDPELGGILRGKEGYFPAYHMNKEHWISIDLRKIEKLDELSKNIISISHFSIWIISRSYS
ncbi:MmcQ/YjbR family DNA-binding protein, partial [Enterococcus faecium]|uniref:MmcQ/YjbR family DNA-binding protein n=1 Tax=Enterococcus faecium TaxID=1352 RepID=UPI00292F81C5